MSDEAVGNFDWYSEQMATFGDRMVGAREAMGMSQADLAKRLGVKLKTVRSWEEDLNEPRANKLQMLAGVLNVSIMWLLTGEGDGVEAPGTEGALSTEMRETLGELRQVQIEMAKLAHHLALLEKRLRATSLADA